MNIFIKYLYWQFVLSPKKILGIIKNYLAFGFDFFSVKESLRSLFSPWRRQSWSYGRGFDIGRYIETFFSNLIARIIGFIMRVFILLLFVLYEIFFLILGAAVFLLVLIYPVLAIWGIIYSFKYL